MTSIIRYLLMALSGIIFASAITGCNDSFMDQYPETNITEKVFFSTPSDLKTYTNGLYGNIGVSYDDAPSDNMLYSENPSLYQVLRGELSAETQGQWSWSDIRNINFMLARTGRVTGSASEINHYIGVARLFRAIRYYERVKTYNDVPWYSRDLQTNDIDLLYKSQDPRSVVVDSIMADLDFACEHMNDGKDASLLFRNAAIGFRARIALNEGTFRKYHPELGLSDADKFLKIAAASAYEIMTTGKYSLSVAQVNNFPSYRSLFSMPDLSSNPEMIFYAAYNRDLGRMHNSQHVFDQNTGLSRSLMEDYLVIKDGKAVPFQTIEGYSTKTFLEIFDNRDPRLSQTFMTPGYPTIGSDDPHRPKQTLGGYPQVKYRPTEYYQWNRIDTDLPIIRYGEILLIYAEAKAELGNLTQSDIDITINALRDRVGMPHAQLVDWMTSIDPIQDNRYPNVNSSQKGAVLEVRRERRIELACEGFRYDDLMRWGAGKLLEKAPEGAYIPGPGYYDVTGDGVPDIAFVMTKDDANKIPAEDKAKYKLTVYTIEGNTIALSEGDHGYIYMIAQKDKFKFEEPKYYYRPVAKKDIVVNENLYQNPFWK